MPSVFAEFKTIPTLSSVEIERMYAIFSKYYINHNREQFTSDLFEKDQVILLRDSQQKTIQGFSTLLKVDLKPFGYQATGIYSGDTVLEKDYWGNKACLIPKISLVRKSKKSNSTGVLVFDIKGLQNVSFNGEQFQNAFS